MRVGVFGSFDKLLLDGLTGHEVVSAEDPCAVSLDDLIGELDGIVIRSPFRLTADQAAVAQRLRWIVRAGTGTDNISPAFAETGVVVRTVPINARAVAELVIGMSIGLLRHIPSGSASLREGRFEKSALVGAELRGRKFGILGFGRLGQEVAQICKALGAIPMAFDRSPGKPSKQTLAAEIPVAFLDLHDLLQRAEILVGCLPDNQESRGLMNASNLDKLAPGCVFINVGRGSLVDLDALYERLMSGRIGGVGLDVYQTEPPPSHPLFSHRRTICTPHLGAQTRDTRQAIAREVLSLIPALARDLNTKSAEPLVSQVGVTS